jgi:hypothetical protein
MRAKKVKTKVIKVPVVEVDVSDIERRAETFLQEGLDAIHPRRPESYFEKIHRLNGVLLSNIKRNLPELEKLLEEINGHWWYEDYVYRFYHASYKVYHAQSSTMDIVDALKKVAPKNVTFNSDFEKIFKEGTGKIFKISHNNNWLKHTRPILEAFFHAKYFLEMAVKYGKELKEAPTCLPSGWAGLLYLYELR